MKKIVLRTRDGEVIRGFTPDQPIQHRISIVTVSGEEKSFEVESLKAVFFVKHFQGDPDYREVKFTRGEPAGKDVWVFLELFDGETLEGLVENDLGLIQDAGIYLRPADVYSNNERVFVSKTSIRRFAVLGLVDQPQAAEKQPLEA